jgi:formate transporter
VGLLPESPATSFVIDLSQASQPKRFVSCSLISPPIKHQLREFELVENTSYQNTFDALLPSEMAERAEHVGVEKTRQDSLRLLALAVLAGAFIAFGSVFSTVATAGAEGALPFGVVRLLAGLTFSLGLILVIVGGAELFTGNNLMVMAYYAAGKVSTAEVARVWGLVYLGNLAGALGIAVLLFAAGGYANGQGTVGLAALAAAQSKTSLSAYQQLIYGILGNILVCLAVWISYGARTVTDKILAIVPPISAFVAAGFEHSIANMYMLPFAIFIKIGAPDAFWSQTGTTPLAFPNVTVFDALTNLVMVTTGNVLGGILVGITYWFIYLRKRILSPDQA